MNSEIYNEIIVRLTGKIASLQHELEQKQKFEKELQDTIDRERSQFHKAVESLEKRALNLGDLETIASCVTQGISAFNFGLEIATEEMIKYVEEPKGEAFKFAVKLHSDLVRDLKRYTRLLDKLNQMRT